MEIQNKELHRITSTAIIRKDGKYLIVKRSLEKKAFPGRWTVPGGGLEVDDYIDMPKTSADAWYFVLTDSLKREIQEETGLSVGELHYLLDLVFIRPDGIPVLTMSYYGDWRSGEVRLNEENTEHRWVTLEDAKNYDLISGIWEEIEMVDKIIKSR